MRAFNEYIAHICVFNFSLCHLDFGATLILQPPNGLTRLANYQANSIIRHNNDVSIRRRCSVGCHHAIIKRLLDYICLVVVQLLGHHQLLMPYFVSSLIVSCDNSLYRGLSLAKTFLIVGNEKHVLLVFVIRLWGGTLLLRTFASD